MRVAAPAAVTLRNDQHVLAQGGEIAAAQRAAVRGWLAVLGPPERPPPGSCQLPRGHGARIAPPPAWVSWSPVEQRPIRILAETERYRITGVVRLPPDGCRNLL